MLSKTGQARGLDPSKPLYFRPMDLQNVSIERSLQKGTGPCARCAFLPLLLTSQTATAAPPHSSHRDSAIGHVSRFDFLDVFYRSLLQGGERLKPFLQGLPIFLLVSAMRKWTEWNWDTCINSLGLILRSLFHPSSPPRPRPVPVLQSFTLLRTLYSREYRAVRQKRRHEPAQKEQGAALIETGWMPSSQLP